MLDAVLKRFIGYKHERDVRRVLPLVTRINELEPSIQALSDDQIRAKIADLKERRARGEPEFSLLPEVFALVREAGWRTLKMRHFDVQLIGGIVLFQGKIAEMRTGEGKTLVATLPLVLNALSGKGGHLITVNDYLAKRDAEWMGQIYRFLGLTVGVIVHGLDDATRREAYHSDITYGTNHEFGFDYLRDNMKIHASQFVQRELNFCIVDEVDSILIDEARTPLIISGPSEDTTDKYYLVNSVIPRLAGGTDYKVDEKERQVLLTEEGIHHLEQLLHVENLYDPQHMELVHHCDQALKAHYLFRKDRDYVVREGEVVIVDEFTGRLSEGRRYSDGLHQALEAKEGLIVQSENQTLASITYQNYFRMYKKLAGMTGTAETEAAEFYEIYKLDVVVIPTNRRMVRTDHADQIYKSESAKFAAVIKEIRELHEAGRPVLVGTASIEKSELLSEHLRKAGIPHHVLNAKHHEREAAIIAEAGQRRAVTIATNMAGRGTDILLGEGIPALGGLHIVGTERHEARRIDNQLRGRAGRQGDPGSSRFYLSLEDDLLRIFGGQRIQTLMTMLKLEDDVPIEAKMVNRAIENAQKRLEGRNFDIRKHLLKYDDVMNEQRKVIYGWRRRIIERSNSQDELFKIFEEMLETVVSEAIPAKVPPSEWNLDQLLDGFERQYGFRPPVPSLTRLGTDQELFETLSTHMMEYYAAREREVTPEVLRRIEHVMLLQIVDEKWRRHLLRMDHLREGINLRGYAQRDPLNEYKNEAFALFQDLIEQIKTEVTAGLFRFRIAQETAPRVVYELKEKQREQEERVRRLNALRSPTATSAPEPQRRQEKPGRNDPCYCGSGKKYKKCHGAKE